MSNNNQGDKPQITVERFLRDKLESEISSFGDGTTEFHTRDIEHLLKCLEEKDSEIQRLKANYTQKYGSLENLEKRMIEAEAWKESAKQALFTWDLVDEFVRNRSDLKPGDSVSGNTFLMLINGEKRIKELENRVKELESKVVLLQE